MSLFSSGIFELNLLVRENAKGSRHQIYRLPCYFARMKLPRHRRPRLSAQNFVWTKDWSPGSDQRLSSRTEQHLGMSENWGYPKMATLMRNVNPIFRQNHIFGLAQKHENIICRWPAACVRERERKKKCAFAFCLPHTFETWNLSKSKGPPAPWCQLWSSPEATQMCGAKSASEIQHCIKLVAQCDSRLF